MRGIFGESFRIRIKPFLESVPLKITPLFDRSLVMMHKPSSRYPLFNGSLASYPVEWSLAFLDLQTTEKALTTWERRRAKNNTHRT